MSQLPTSVFKADENNFRWLREVQIRSLLLGNFNWIDRAFFVKIYNINSSKIVSLYCADDSIAVWSIIWSIHDRSWVPFFVNNNLIHYSSLSLLQQKFKLQLFFVRLLLFQHLYHKCSRIELFQIGFSIVAVFLFGRENFMQFSVLAGDQNFLSITIPSQIINFVSCFEKTVWCNFAEIRIIKSQEEQRASGISNNYDTAFSVALYLCDSCLMYLKCLD